MKEHDRVYQYRPGAALSASRTTGFTGAASGGYYNKGLTHMTSHRRQQALHEYCARLHRVLGDQLDSLLLYGSQARGDAVEGSDIDVLVIMKGPFDYGDLLERTSEPTAEISLEYDVVLSRGVLHAGRLSVEPDPFSHERPPRGRATVTNANVQALLNKAGANLDAARLLLGAGHLDSAASRAYYAMFPKGGKPLVTAATHSAALER